MQDKIIYAIGNVLMVVEAVALVFLIVEWFKAKGDLEDENNT